MESQQSYDIFTNEYEKPVDENQQTVIDIPDNSGIENDANLNIEVPTDNLIFEDFDYLFEEKNQSTTVNGTVPPPQDETNLQIDVNLKTDDVEAPQDEQVLPINENHKFDEETDDAPIFDLLDFGTLPRVFRPCLDEHANVVSFPFVANTDLSCDTHYFDKEFQGTPQKKSGVANLSEFETIVQNHVTANNDKFGHSRDWHYKACAPFFVKHCDSSFGGASKIEFHQTNLKRAIDCHLFYCVVKEQSDEIVPNGSLSLCLREPTARQTKRPRFSGSLIVSYPWGVMENDVVLKMRHGNVYAVNAQLYTMSLSSEYSNYIVVPVVASSAPLFDETSVKAKFIDLSGKILK